MNIRMSSTVTTLSVALACLGTPVLGQVSPQQFDCGTQQFSEQLAALRAEVRAGTKPHPGERMPPVVRPKNPSSLTIGPGLVTTDDIFAYEDSANLLSTDFSIEDLNELLADAANALLVEHGDNFDFVGFWTSAQPDHTIGAAVYGAVMNDVTGIGDIVFDYHAESGLAGSEMEGIVVMWWIDSPLWAPGTGPEADVTRLILGQEFEHRFGMYLPPLLDGRELQGDDATCGRSGHWSFRVDGQGSSMEIHEWVGSSPAVPSGFTLSYNSDIPGSVFSYCDLYLMGYVTAAEMDAGNSELRFMDDSTCSSDYFGAISDFDSSDIIASAGPRVPAASAEDKHYRTGWIMLHPPGAPPSMTQLVRAAAILNQHSADFSYSTLGLGSMDNTLPDAGLFTDLGNGLAGSAGVPVLVGGGTLIGGDPVSLTISGAKDSAPVSLVIGLSAIFAPFKGGVMVPDPDLIISGLSTDLNGARTLIFTMPSGLPPDSVIHLQDWISDPLGPANYAATNGLALTTP